MGMCDGGVAFNTAWLDFPLHCVVGGRVVLLCDVGNGFPYVFAFCGFMCWWDGWVGFMCRGLVGQQMRLTNVWDFLLHCLWLVDVCCCCVCLLWFSLCMCHVWFHVLVG